MKIEFLALALGILSALNAQKQEPRVPSLIVLSKDRNALIKAFNQDVDKTRLLLLVSPT